MGFVHVFRSGNGPAHKIGKTRRAIADRLKDYETSNPEEFTLVHQIETEHYTEVETFIKRSVASHRILGRRELFNLQPTILGGVIEAAHSYLAFLPEEEEVEALSQLPADSARVVPARAEDQAVRRRLLELDEEIAVRIYERDRLRAGMKRAIGTAAGLGSLATWKSFPKDKLDPARLKEERPEVHAEYTEKVIERRFRLL